VIIDLASKALGCSHSIITVRKITERFIKAGYTTDLCSIDLSKAFGSASGVFDILALYKLDYYYYYYYYYYKVNHNCPFLKLMDRRIPVELLQCLEIAPRILCVYIIMIDSRPSKLIETLSRADC